MGNWNQDSSGLSDEDMDQSLQQDIAMAGAMADGAQTTGNYTFGGNFVNDADNPGYTGPSTNMNQAVTDMQSLFNTQRGITASNPYGKEGLFSRVLGIDPSKIDYSANMNLNTRMGIANNQFSKYMNPQNVKGQIGYNPAYDPAGEGKLRAGVQDAGYQTVYGPVMEQARKQGTGEMLARGSMGLAGGPVGMALAQIGTKEYGLPGVTGFERFDPNNPNPGGGLLGQFLGGLNPTQAKDALVGAFAPVVPAPEPTSIGTAPADIGSGSKTLENGVTITPMSNGMNEITMPDGRKTTQNLDGTINSFSSRPDQQQSSLDPDRVMDALTGGIRGGIPTALNMTGEQLAGLFGDDPRTAGFRDLEGMIKSVVDGENFPDDQNMYGPGMPDQTPLSPDELNNLLEPLGMELGRGSSTANQFAQVDYSNLKNVGGNMYQPVPETSAFDSFLEKFGMRERKRKPSGQIYSPSGSSSFFGDMFDNLRN